MEKESLGYSELTGLEKQVDKTHVEHQAWTVGSNILLRMDSTMKYCRNFSKHLPKTKKQQKPNSMKC